MSLHQSAYTPLLHPFSTRLTLSPFSALSARPLPLPTFSHMLIFPNRVQNILPLVVLYGQHPQRPLALAKPHLSPASD